MKTYDVYPKEGERFSFRCGSLKVTEGKICIRNDNGASSKDRFLSLSKIAAIVPQPQSGQNMIHFLVYLKDKRPFPVFAHGFVTEPKVSFEIQSKDEAGNVLHREPIDDIYVDLSEIVAVVPAEDGIVRA